mmetsp:Transcript_27043/g.57962  ORF Transcript_27043/g.57962 Transcript_27043/m.57962 type:complete len:767 (+) Transcript_27043:44-2344(+)
MSFAKTFNEEFHSYDAFEAVLRRHAHPAAVADLDTLPREGASWRRLLEALGRTCRDNAIQWTVNPDINNVQLNNHDGSNCVVCRAIIDMGGPMMVEVLSRNNICHQIQASLQAYGRPIEHKSRMLSQHEARDYNVRLRADDKRSNDMVQTSSSMRKNADNNSTKVDWSKLKKMPIKDLKLYETNQGKYLEGKILVDPFTPMVGTITILEDSNGDVILVALYNLLPDGLHGEDSVAVASAKIPKGGTIRIAEPYMKVFRDGSRGIRIDDPSDIFMIVGDGSDSVNEDVALANAKALGNSLVQKKMYNAASDAYIDGIRKASLVPTLLSNRSQAYAMAKDWENSLADAAASLTMRPANKKTWARYKKALEMLSNGKSKNGADKRDAAGQILRRVLVVKPRDLASTLSSISTGGGALDLKNEGNKLFENREYNAAAVQYTAALHVCGEVPRALLGNWAFCSLHTGANLDAVAASAASLRIRPEAKTVARLARGLLLLGEPNLCCSILRGKYGEVLKGTAFTDEKVELLRCSEVIFEFIKTHRMQDPKPFDQPRYLPQWIRGIETFDAGPKRGRGVRACINLKKGHVALIEPPIASAHAGKVDNEMVFSIDKTERRRASYEYIRQAIIVRSQHEAVLSKIVDCLYDGDNQPPVTALEDLVPNLGSCQALLPSHHAYVLDRVDLTAHRIESILSFNSHGGSNGLSSDSLRRSDLFPAISMFNHSNEPNCSWEDVGGCAIIWVSEDIAIGSELTLRYHEDKKVLKKQWGISS